MLFLAKTIQRETGESNHFLVAARSRDEVTAMIEDDNTRIVEVFTTPADIAEEIEHSFDTLALLCNI